MALVLSFLLGLAAVVSQTAVLPVVFPGVRFFDLALPLVIYVSIFLPPARSAGFLLVFGAVVDAISGGPFGLFTITYIWLLIGLRGSMHFLDAGSLFLFPLILVIGVFLEEVLAVLVVSTVPDGRLLIRVFWALGTAPLFLVVFRALYGRCRHMAEAFNRDAQELSR